MTRAEHDMLKVGEHSQNNQGSLGGQDGSRSLGGHASENGSRSQGGQAGENGQFDPRIQDSQIGTPNEVPEDDHACEHGEGCSCHTHAAMSPQEMYAAMLEYGIEALDEFDEPTAPEKLGIIGGLGPAATARLFARVVEYTRAETDQGHLDVTVLNRPSIPDRTAYLLGKPGAESFIEPMQQAVCDLVAAGCGVLATPCNTAHARIEEIVGVLGEVWSASMLCGEVDECSTEADCDCADECSSMPASAEAGTFSAEATDSEVDEHTAEAAPDLSVVAVHAAADAMFVDMPQSAVQFACELGCSKVGIMATDGAVAAGVYQRACEDRGMHYCLPNEETQARIMSIIYDDVKAGRSPEPHAVEAVCSALEDVGCDCLMLGCTELSLLGLPRRRGNVCVVDALDVLAWACVNACGAPAHNLKGEYVQ